jgi:hypothetical protein
LVDVRPGEIELKSHVEAYESARTSAHRIVLVTCFVSLALLGIARTPGIKISKLEQWGIAFARPQSDLKTDPILVELFPGSYAVVLGILLIPVLIHWSYAALTAALGLRSSLLAGSALGRPESERLRTPLVGSPLIRGDSRVAWWAAIATILVASFTPIVCDALLLSDYTLKFAFDCPRTLWFGFPGPSRPSKYFDVPSDFHPTFLPPYQSWFCLLLFVDSLVLTWSVYWRVIVGKPFLPFLLQKVRLFLK